MVDCSLSVGTLRANFHECLRPGLVDDVTGGRVCGGARRDLSLRWGGACRDAKHRRCKDGSPVESNDHEVLLPYLFLSQYPILIGSHRMICGQMTRIAMAIRCATKCGKTPWNTSATGRPE